MILRSAAISSLALWALAELSLAEIEGLLVFAVVLAAVEITIQTDPVGDASSQNVLLPEPIHLRLVESRSEINHSRRGVVVFSVVAEAGGLFRKQLAEGRIRFAYYIFPRQSAAEGVPGGVVADLRSHAASAVVHILRPGVPGNRGDPLQTVGVAGGFAVFAFGDDHAVTAWCISTQGTFYRAIRWPLSHCWSKVLIVLI